MKMVSDTVGANRRGAGVWVWCAGISAALVWSCWAVAPASAQTRPDDDPAQSTDGAGGPQDDPGDQMRDDSVRRSVEVLLSGYHAAPSRDELVEVADPAKVASTLRSVASDERSRPSMRLRAVDALAKFPTDRTVEFLTDRLEGDEQSDARDIDGLLRHHAVSSLAQIWPDDRAADRLGAFLESEQVQLQLTTITALGRHAGDPGRDRLRQRARDVERPAVREQLKTYVEIDGGGDAE